MFAILLLLFALNSSSSTPIPTFDNDTNREPITLLGRALPECMNIARFRTLQEIIWSCLVTIFACTWLAVHPNLPGPNDCAWTKLKRRVTTLVYAILAPELITMWAMRQWFDARRIAREVHMKDDDRAAGADIKTVAGVGEGDEDGGNNKPEVIVDAGANINVRGQAKIGKIALCRLAIKNFFKEWFRDGPRASQSKEWTLTHGFFLQMGGFMLCNGEKPLRVLDLDELRKLIREKKVDLPRISEDEINDKSKGDFLTKLAVILQTTWFIVQCLARWITHLPVTELEVITLAFAALNIITYGLWWNKPQNVLVAVSVPMKEGGDEEPQPSREREESWIAWKLRSARKGGCCGWVFGIPKRLFQGFLRPFGKLMGMNGTYAPEDLPNPLRMPIFHVDGHVRNMWNIGNDRNTRADPQADFPSLAIGFLFGAIHLIPWSSNFPSIVERWLWRSSDLVITTEPILIFLYGQINNARWDDGNCISITLFLLVSSVMLVGFPLYLLARFTLLVLAFTTLRAPPPHTYANILWTTFVPHI